MKRWRHGNSILLMNLISTNNYYICINLDKMEKKQFAFIKVRKIIDSCKTIEQLQVAANCVNNYFRLYPEDDNIRKLKNLILSKYESL